MYFRRVLGQGQTSVLRIGLGKGYGAVRGALGRIVVQSDYPNKRPPKAELEDKSRVSRFPS